MTLSMHWTNNHSETKGRIGARAKTAAMHVLKALALGAGLAGLLAAIIALRLYVCLTVLHGWFDPAWGHEYFVPVWDNPLVIYSNFVSSNAADEVYSTVRVAANGFQTKNLSLDKKVRDRILDLSKY